jgi:hypothetical protein
MLNMCWKHTAHPASPPASPLFSRYSILRFSTLAGRGSFMSSFKVGGASMSGIWIAGCRLDLVFANVCAVFILPEGSCTFEAWPLPRMLSRIRIVAAAGLPTHGGYDR